MTTLERRGFLGSVIGLFGAAALPFTALEAIAGPAYDYRIALWSNHGFIWAPPVTITRLPNAREFYTELKVTSTFTYRGMTCVNPEGLIVGSNYFSSDVRATAGDVMKVRYTLNNNFPFSQIQPGHAMENDRTVLKEERMEGRVTLADIKRLV